MKRVTTLIVSLALPILLLAACAGSSPQQQATPDPEPEPTTEPAPDNEPLVISQIFEGADDAVEVPLDGSWFEWDGNGDGTPEEYSLDFEDNGDEARSGFIIMCYQEGIDGEWLDGAYGIRGLYAYTSADGTPMLGILYDAGDFYYHDGLGSATLRLDGNQLHVDYLDYLS